MCRQLSYVTIVYWSVRFLLLLLASCSEIVTHSKINYIYLSIFLSSTLLFGLLQLNLYSSYNYLYTKCAIGIWFFLKKYKPTSFSLWLFYFSLTSRENPNWIRKSSINRGQEKTGRKRGRKEKGRSRGKFWFKKPNRKATLVSSCSKWAGWAG